MYQALMVWLWVWSVVRILTMALRAACFLRAAFLDAERILRMKSEREHAEVVRKAMQLYYKEAHNGRIQID